MLITLIGWKDTPYTNFFEQIGWCHTTWFTLLGRKLDPKHRSSKTGTFSRYFGEIQESIVNSWRITPDVFAQLMDIANFKASRNNMWIKVCRDPRKEWLQLRYCIMEEDVEMAMRDRHDDWKIRVLIQEVPKGTEVNAG
jgi:hypothetical protein